MHSLIDSLVKIHNFISLSGTYVQARDIMTQVNLVNKYDFTTYTHSKARRSRPKLPQNVGKQFKITLEISLIRGYTFLVCRYNLVLLRGDESLRILGP